MIPVQMKREFAEQHIADLRRAAGNSDQYDFPPPQPVEMPIRPRPRPWVFNRRLLVRLGILMPPAPGQACCP